MLPAIWSDLAQSKTDKQIETRMWDLVRAYLEDRQTNLSFDLRTNQLVATGSPGARGKIQFNVLKQAYRKLASLLATNVPGIRAVPASTSIEDIVKSEATGLASQYYWRQCNMTDVVGSKLVPWLLATGNGFLHTRFNSSTEKVVTECVSPYDVFPEPNCIDVDEPEWWAIRTLTPRKNVEEAYPEHAEYLREYQPATKRDQLGSSTDSNVPAGRLEVWTVYFRDGRYGVACGEKWLFEGTLPPGAEPLTFFRYTYFGGRLWGHSPFVSAIDLQAAYNRRKNLELDNAELMSNGMWMVPQGSVVNPTSISNKPGKVVVFNAAAGTPTRVSGSGMPVDWAQGNADLMASISDMLGLHAVSLGKRAIGITSGKAMETLANNDISQLQMTMNNIELGLSRVAKSAICFMAAFYPEGVLVNMMDESGRVISEQIKSTDLIQSPEVYFEASSLFRLESEDMDAQTLGLYNAKLLDADEARRRLSFRIADYKATRKMRSWAHAQKLLAAATGQLGWDKGVEIFPTDDLEAIGEVFNEYMESDAYYNLPDERQDYVAGILAACKSKGTLTPDQLAEAANKRIWPVQPKSAKDAAQYATSTQSNMVAAQANEQAAMMQQSAEAQQNAVEMAQSQAEAAPTGVA